MEKTKNKNLLFIGASIVLIGALFFMNYILMNEETTKPKKESQTGAINEETPEYTITAFYPKTKSPTLNKNIKKFVEKEIQEFKAKYAVEGNPEQPGELVINWEMSENKVMHSLNFSIYKIISGAHGEESNKIYYFDNLKNEEIAFEDLFVDNDNSFKKLSELSLQVLSKSKKPLFSTDDVKTALTANKDNLKLLSFQKDYVSLQFPKYSVAPGSSGIVKVRFSYAELEGIIKDTYRNIDTPSPESKKPYEQVPSDGRKMRDIHTLENKQYILLTFDDGPSGEATEKLLNELQKRDVKVSFFVLGINVEKYPELLKRAYTEGHSIASHGYNHRNLVNLSETEMQSQFTTTNEAIHKAIGVYPVALRPPYGSYNDTVTALSKNSLVLWNVDTEDWKNKNADTVYQNILSTAKDGNIVLLHDLYATSVDGAIRAIDTLKERGYEFISLEEAVKLGLLQLDEKTIHYQIKK